MRSFRFNRKLPTVVLGWLFFVVPAKAQFVANWFDRVSQTQRQQPQWMTPVATTTPRLDQEIHFDTDILRQSNGFTTDDYGGSKGFELIPAEHLQVNVNPPPYLAHDELEVPDGFGDFSFLVKYRLVARNEKSGNYVMTVFLAGSPPTSSAPSSASLFRSPVKRRAAEAVFGTMRSKYQFSRILWP